MAPFSKWLIIERSPLKLAEKINYYSLNPQKAKKLTENAYNWVVHHTWEDLSEEYLDLWGKKVL